MSEPESLANYELEAIVASLARAGVSVSYVERALGLEQGTVNRWRGARVPFEGLALMRVVAAMPWILEAAAAGFDPTTARRTLLHAAAELVP